MMTSHKLERARRLLMRAVELVTGGMRKQAVMLQKLFAPQVAKIVMHLEAEYQRLIRCDVIAEQATNHSRLHH